MKYTHYHLDKSQRKAPPLCGRIHYVTMLHSQQHPLFRNRFCLATAASLAGTELFICYLTFMVILSMCLTLWPRGLESTNTRLAEMARPKMFGVVGVIILEKLMIDPIGCCCILFSEGPEFQPSTSIC